MARETMRRGGIPGGLLACLLACPAATAAPSIDSLPLAAAYGNGVHAYFAGDFQRAYDECSQAIEGGTLDPRAWYYRGLAALKLGRLDEAQADFSTGAAREADGTGAFPVSKSLERVQGCDRLALERHRTRARVAQLRDERRRDRLRYLDVERAEPEVLRRRRPVVERPTDAANPFEMPAEDVPALPPPEEIPGPVADPAEPAAEPARRGRDEGLADQLDQRNEREAAEEENLFEQRDQQRELDAVP